MLVLHVSQKDKEEKTTKHGNSGKMDTTTIVIIALFAFLLIGGGLSLPKIDLSNLNFLDDLFGGGTTGLVDVEKCLDFALINEYAGSALGSKTLYVYDSDGETLLETLTTASDGTIASAFPYKSGSVIYVNYVSSNDKKWWKLTVPQMNALDAESATVNTIKLKAFAIGTYTSDTLKHGGTTIADAGEYNFTTSGTIMTFTYSLANTGNDNTGIQDSYDPVYKQNWNVVVYITFSGTGYETVLVHGFNTDFTLGTTHYVASTLNAYELTKHKVGTDYKSIGVDELSFTLDGEGYSGSGCTMQITVKAYADANYAQSHGGNFGTASVEIAEHTVTLKTA